MPIISRRKQHYDVSQWLGQYLYHFGRYTDIPLVYDELLRFTGSIPYEDPSGKETLWLTVMYPHEVMMELRPQLTQIYSELKVGGDTAHHEHLMVDRIDFGEFGNSRPFRIRITNKYNDNSDYYYVKHADASRIYGLELEHILSPNRINYMIRGNTLIEEHIAGLPGDVFSQDYLTMPEINRIRIAKEFVKFNERCFIRLLGDMRSVNYVVDVTPDFEEVQYRVRPIDFDQQSYQGGAKIYMAYRFSSNRDVTRLSFREMNRTTIAQYAEEERTQMARRARAEKRRLQALLASMAREELSPQKHVSQLREELMRIHETDRFSECETMGELTKAHIEYMLYEPDFTYRGKRTFMG
ncbi:MAG: hypothetical protein HN759_10590 [Akkermansiaceae bacterium]|jgi:hypothetical protein|nr:hypothetical protein [Akkermansiaceae bacterium]